MLALRVKGLIIPMKNSWTMHKKGIATTTTANYIRCQNDKRSTIVKKDSDFSGLYKYQSQLQYYRNYSKKTVNALLHVNYIQKYQLCSQIPPKQKPLLDEASSTTNKPSKTKNPSSNDSTTKTQSVDSSSSQTKYTQSNNDNQKSADSVKTPDINLPSREQVEKYFFRTLVFIWDLAVYLSAITMKLIDQYILKNPTFKKYWNVFLQKLENARKEMKK